MAIVPEHVSRQLESIFAGRDDRAFVILRVRAQLFSDTHALAWLARMRERYDSELELLLLISSTDQCHEPDASESIDLPLATELAICGAPKRCESVSLVSWMLCDSVRPRPADYLRAVLASRSIGWLLSCPLNESIARIADDAGLDACNLRRTVLDLSGSGIPETCVAAYAHAFFLERVANGDEPCGIAFDLAASGESGPADKCAWQVDATEALLDAVASAITMRRIAAHTRLSISLRRML